MLKRGRRGSKLLKTVEEHECIQLKSEKETSCYQECAATRLSVEGRAGQLDKPRLMVVEDLAQRLVQTDKLLKTDL